MDDATRKKIAKIIRMFGAPEHGVQANAWRSMARLLETKGLSWTDIGNVIEYCDFTEDELRELFETALKEATKRVQAQQSNGHITLPTLLEMAEFCRQRSNVLKDDKQRDFVCDMYIYAQRGMNLSRGRLGYLASIYIQSGGQIQ
jgi:hypothetical protein